MNAPTERRMQDSLRLDQGQIEIIDDVMAEVLKRKTPADRIHIGFNLWKSAHDILMVHLKKTHPEWSAETLNKEVAKRLAHGAI